MNKKAAIRITADSGGQTAEFDLSGTYYEKNGVHYISYAQPLYEGAEPVMSTVKTDGRSVTVIRFGGGCRRMHFDKNKVFSGLYSTDFGSFDMEIETSRITVEITSCGGEITLEYIMRLSGSELKNVFHMKFDV